MTERFESPVVAPHWGPPTLLPSNGRNIGRPARWARDGVFVVLALDETAIGPCWHLAVVVRLDMASDELLDLLRRDFGVPADAVEDNPIEGVARHLWWAATPVG